MAKTLILAWIYYYRKNDKPSKIKVIVLVILLILAFMIYGSIKGFSSAAIIVVGLGVLSTSNMITTITSLLLIYSLREILINFYVNKNDFNYWTMFVMSIFSRALVLFIATITLVNGDNFILQDFLKYIFVPVFLCGLIVYIFITPIYFLLAREKNLQDRLVNLRKIVYDFEEDIKSQWKVECDSRAKIRKEMSIKY